MSADQTLTILELSRTLGLPVHVLRRFVDRHGLALPRRYPHQWRRVPAARLAELRGLLAAEGYQAA